MIVLSSTNVDFARFVPFIMFGVVILIVCVIGYKVKQSVQRATRAMRSTISDVSNIVNAVKQVAEAVEEIPDIKTVGGATDMFLSNITRDFPDFHNSSAESDIRTFLQEYVDIVYGSKTEFTKSAISGKIDIAANKVNDGVVNNIVFNKIAIYDYKKTKEYATIKYRVSIGFDVDGKRIETRYEVGYTYQMYDNEIATKAIKCSNCGAPIDDLSKGRCPYCGAAVIKDTIMSWDITSIDNF